MVFKEKSIKVINDEFQLGKSYPKYGLVLQKRVVDPNMITVKFFGKSDEIYFDVDEKSGKLIEV